MDERLSWIGRHLTRLIVGASVVASSASALCQIPEFEDNSVQLAYNVKPVSIDGGRMSHASLSGPVPTSFESYGDSSVRFNRLRVNRLAGLATVGHDGTSVTSMLNLMPVESLEEWLGSWAIGTLLFGIAATPFILLIRSRKAKEPLDQALLDYEILRAKLNGAYLS